MLQKWSRSAVFLTENVRAAPRGAGHTAGRGGADDDDLPISACCQTTYPGWTSASRAPGRVRRGDGVPLHGPPVAVSAGSATGRCASRDLLAEASGSRTHRRRGAPPTGFEDQARHRPEIASKPILAFGRRSDGPVSLRCKSSVKRAWRSGSRRERESLGSLRLRPSYNVLLRGRMLADAVAVNTGWDFPAVAPGSWDPGTGDGSQRAKRRPQLVQWAARSSANGRRALPDL